MSWKDNAGISGQFDRVRELAGQIRKHEEATTQKLMESEEKVKNLLRENAILRQKLLGGYHFTKDQMKEHDLQVAKRARQEAVQYVTKMQRDAMNEKYAEHMKQFEKESEEFWGNLAKEFKSGTEEESFMAWCRHMWGIPIEVLVEEFHWKPITEDCCCDNRQNLVKFCNKCAERAEKISRDQMADIRTYCKDVAEKYGAGFVLEG